MIYIQLFLPYTVPWDSQSTKVKEPYDEMGGNGVE